jgi:Putative zinc-finger
MFYHDSHLSDEELVLAVDGEMKARRYAAVREHLASCPACRARSNEMEMAMREFERLYRHDRESHALGSNAPPIAVSRALLRSRLAELAMEGRASFAVRIFGFRLPRAYQYVFAASLGALVLMLAIGFRALMNPPGPGAHRLEAAAVPQPQLTPGATVPVTTQEVCSAGPAGNSLNGGPAIPASLERQVFEEYGIRNPPPDAYEIDYLIAPELGGATNIRNLWPQPYHNTVWHARIKDQLEERLHAMVCRGEIDLPTAQHDIATDWISAYKKYFHTDKPLGGRPTDRNPVGQPAAYVKAPHRSATPAG